VKSLNSSKKAADDSNRSVLDLRAELARTQAAHHREKEDILAKVQLVIHSLRRCRWVVFSASESGDGV
jgi:hypothetical protein